MSVEPQSDDAQDQTVSIESAEALHELLGDVYQHERAEYLAADTEWMANRRQDRVVAVRETRRALENNMSDEEATPGLISLEADLTDPAMDAITTYVREESDVSGVPGHVLAGMADMPRTLRSLAIAL